MTQREEVNRAGMCGEPGKGFWNDRGELCPTLCMKIKGHNGPHEELSGAFLWQIDLEMAAARATAGGGEAGAGG